MSTLRQLPFVHPRLMLAPMLLMMLSVSCKQPGPTVEPPLPTPASSPDDGATPAAVKDSDLGTTLPCPDAGGSGLRISSTARFVPASQDSSASDQFRAEAIGTVAMTTTVVNSSMCVFVTRRNETLIDSGLPSAVPGQRFKDESSIADSGVMIDQIVVGPNENRLVRGNYSIPVGSPLVSASRDFLGGKITTSLNVAAISPWVDEPSAVWQPIDSASGIESFASASSVASSVLLTVHAQTQSYKRVDPRGEIGTLGNPPSTVTPEADTNVTLYSYEPAPNGVAEFYPWSIGSTFSSTLHCYTALNPPPSSTPGWIAGLVSVATTEATAGRKNSHSGTAPSASNPQNTSGQGIYSWTVTEDRCYFVVASWGSGVNTLTAISPLVGVVPSKNDPMEILDLCIKSDGTSVWKKCSLVDTE